MPKPNIFAFATSELSQDAFICWLASWAGPEASGTDHRLAALGTAFVEALFQKHSRELPKIEALRVKRQYKNIDVLLVVNSTYAVCIEDKVGTTEHSRQLQRYIAALEGDGFSPSNILPIYVQTHEQATFDSVRDAGYATFGRNDFLNVLGPFLQPGADTGFEADFYEHLQGIEDQVQAFTVRSLSEWPWPAWQGFFGELRKRLSTGMWAYVPNQTGGFLAFWWHHQTDATATAYLQLEMDALCFKISVAEATADSRARTRDNWMRRIVAAAHDLHVPVRRPRRLGNGRTMTVATLEGDYRQPRPESSGLLDMERTLTLLQRAQAVLDRSASKGA